MVLGPAVWAAGSARWKHDAATWYPERRLSMDKDEEEQARMGLVHMLQDCSLKTRCDELPPPSQVAGNGQSWLGAALSQLAACSLQLGGAAGIMQLISSSVPGVST